jgi:hypothetical protein
VALTWARQRAGTAIRGNAQVVLLTVNDPVMPFWACPGTGHR